MAPGLSAREDHRRADDAWSFTQRVAGSSPASGAPSSRASIASPQPQRIEDPSVFFGPSVPAPE
jgi:hypothetical protein